MVLRPMVLCPVDFSDASRGALRYARALAEHFYATLSVLTVDDPLLARAATGAFGAREYHAQIEAALREFVHSVLPAQTLQVAELEFLIAAGQPAARILEIASARRADVIVMSTHGASGIRKAIFGSTTERVLRGTAVPVIVSPAADAGPDSLEAWKAHAQSILAPVDLSAFSSEQLRIASGLAQSVGASLVVAHIIEPLVFHGHHVQILATVEATRQAHVYERLDALTRGMTHGCRPKVEVASGDVATEIANLARRHKASAIVMALHSSPESAHRIGTITYRVLCESPALVVAVPPAHHALDRLIGSRPAAEALPAGTRS